MKKLKQAKKAIIIASSLVSGMMLFVLLATPAFAERNPVVPAETLVDKKEEFAALEKEIEDMKKEMEDLNASIAENEADLEETQANIQTIQNGILLKLESIGFLQNKISKRQDILKERLVVMQEQPKTNVVTEVLLNSKSVADLLERMHAVATLFKSDQDILKVQKSDQAKLEKEKTRLQEKEAAMLDAQQKLQALQTELTGLQREKEEKLRILEQKALALQTAITELETANNELVADHTVIPGDGSFAPGTAEALISYAKQYLGLPYIWGSSSPVNGGFDCSGFIYWVYSHNGYDIERQTAEGYWSMVQKISNPVPGDLVFFQNTYKPGPSHIGIYLGNGQFIHASSKGIAINSVYSSYNTKHFLGYGRL
jgi:cell wall-associated NlpC family hydrolase